MPRTYLTTQELSERIKYEPRTIRDCLEGQCPAGRHPLHPPVRGQKDPLHLGAD